MAGPLTDFDWLNSLPLTTIITAKCLIYIKRPPCLKSRTLITGICVLCSHHTESNTLKTELQDQHMNHCTCIQPFIEIHFYIKKLLVISEVWIVIVTWPLHCKGYWIKCRLEYLDFPENQFLHILIQDKHEISPSVFNDVVVP